MYKYLLLIILICAGCTHAADCSQPQSVKRIDERNRRLFVVVNATLEFGKNDVEKLIPVYSEYIKSCHGEWGDDWVISVFGDEKYVGYLDEKAVRKYVTDGSWSENYLAEYNHLNNKVDLYPAKK